MSTPNADDPRPNFLSELQAFLQQIAEELPNLPTRPLAEQYRIAQNITDQASRITAQIDQMTARLPDVFKQIGEGLTLGERKE